MKKKWAIPKKKSNIEAINTAIGHNPDGDHSAGFKTVDVEEAVWQWQDSPNPISYGPGYAYSKDFYATGDLIFECPCIDGGPGGPAPSYSSAFQSFSYDEDQNMLKITGNMQVRNYTVQVFFKN